MKSIFILFMALVLSTALWGQSLRQTIRGQVSDIDTRQPLIGATVVVLGSNPTLGASTDAEGNFVIERVPVGRIDLAVSYMGYEEQVMPSLVLTSAKQLVVQVALRESVVKMTEVVIGASTDKAALKNEMLTTSARTLSVEETSRFAGTFNDPARMAANFAGVASNPMGNNDIVVRGNSPHGICWRLEGVEIPNPNHFADEGTTGGPINALNSAMLANSDFLTGAFAPEYGNAYSGVMDMWLRSGNDQKREYSFSAGVLGVDLTAEGPIGYGQQKGTYLANYRYSSLAILDNLDVISFGGIPKYQDASFKAVLPAGKAGKFTLVGLGGYSTINDRAIDTLDGVETEVFRNSYSAYMGTLILKHGISLSKHTFLHSSVSTSVNGSAYWQEERGQDGAFVRNFADALHKTALRGQAIIDHKINASNQLRGGLYYTHQLFDMEAEYWDQGLEAWVKNLDDKGNAGLAQGFVSWRYRPGPRLSIVPGLHYTHFLLSGDHSLEPRLGMRWQVGSTTYLTGGYGRHTRPGSLLTYLAQSQEGSTTTQPNKHLRMMRANHLVAGVEQVLGSHYRIKVEGYYQALGQVPVYANPANPESAINSYDSYTAEKMVNEGTGRNYGLEFTAERYMHRGFYMLATASVFESKYTPKDGVERNTPWNTNTMANLLGGKEWQLSPQKGSTVLGINAKLAFMGGIHVTPILLDESREQGRTVWDTKHLYQNKGDDVFQANASVYLRVNRHRVSHEFKIDVQNVTNNGAVVMQYYNPTTGRIESGRQLPMLPNMVYTLQF
ncbi:MAG: TonB-dependent receptor [Bacteroidetes bacterium]|jgi:hypothetical protein|nr:TonB-dependent receptor [Bacteroidota bacterium]